MWRLRVFLLIISFVALSACGSTKAPPALPTTAPLPTDTAPEATENPQATQPVVENQVNIPGKLLFVRRENGTGNIWIHEGSGARRITTTGKKFHAAWSPDGSKIAYIQREESFSDIWVMNADGSSKTQITDNEPDGVPARSEEHIVSIKWAFQPQWSPDGDYLAYISQKQPPTQIGDAEFQEYPLSLFVYGTRRIGQGTFADGAFQRFVRPDTDLSSPTWSADGTMIVYSQAERCFSCDAPTTLGFDTLDIAGGNDTIGVLQSSSDNFDRALDPAFSPDGKWLAYVKNEANNSNIWVIPAPDEDGVVSGKAFQITTEGRARKPTWSPDSAKLAYFVINDLVSMMMADVTSNGSTFQLSNKVEIHNDVFDVESGMSWVK